MQQNKAVTYSILAHIRNTGTLIKGPLDIFVPLIKRILHQLNERGINKGKSIFEIKQLADETYAIDFPLPVIKNILFKLAEEVNTNNQKNFELFRDGSFIIKDYLFLDFEEYVQSSKKEIERIEKLFVKFCSINKVEPKDKTSILDFIDKNKVAISKYLSNRIATTERDQSVEAEFIKFFKNIPEVYDLIKNIYLGSIITSYLEYKTENSVQNIELVIDTNFIVSLLDLNTIESTHTCMKLIEIGKNIGYRFTILQDTLDETRRLIGKKAEHFDTTFLPKKINPEDIFNACERRRLTAVDLERIGDNLENELSAFEISFVYETTKYRNLAKFSIEYEILKKHRNSDTAALHDALAIFYIREKRKKKFREFEKVNCWFVNNSTSHEAFESSEFDNFTARTQPESIKAEELLNILWLSNPRVNANLNTSDLADIGLSSLVAVTLNASLPKSSIIRELDENIQKYAEASLTDRDILLVSTRIVNRQMKNINELNTLAKRDQAEFINKLKEEVNKQENDEKEKAEKFNLLLEQLKNQSIKLDKVKNSFEENKKNIEEEASQSKKEAQRELLDIQQKYHIEKNTRIDLENNLREQRKGEYIKKEIQKWRNINIRELVICLLSIIAGILFIFYYSNWNWENVKINFKELQGNFFWVLLIPFLGIIFSAFLIPSLLLKYRNHSNIEAYTRKIKIPREMEPIEE